MNRDGYDERNVPRPPPTPFWSPLARRLALPALIVLSAGILFLVSISEYL